MCVGVWSTHGGSDNFSSTHSFMVVVVVVVVDKPVWPKGAVGDLSRVRDTIKHYPY